MILETVWKIVLSLTTLTTLIFNTIWKIIPSLTKLILEATTNYTNYTDIQYYIRNNFIDDYADYADL